MGLVISYVCEHSHASLISFLGFELKEQAQKNQKTPRSKTVAFF